MFGNRFVNYSPSSGFRRGLIWNGIQQNKLSKYGFEIISYFGGNAADFLNFYSADVYFWITKGKNPNKFVLRDYSNAGIIPYNIISFSDNTHVPLIFLDADKNTQFFINSQNGMCLGDEVYKIRQDLIDIGVSDVQIEDITIYNLFNNTELYTKRKMCVLYFDLNTPYLVDTGSNYLFVPPQELLDGVNLKDKSFIYDENTPNIIKKEQNGYYQNITSFWNIHNFDISTLKECKLTTEGSFSYSINQNNQMQFNGAVVDTVKFNSDYELNFAYYSAPSVTLFLTSDTLINNIEYVERVPEYKDNFNFENTDNILLYNDATITNNCNYGFKLENTNHDFDFKGGSDNIKRLDLYPQTSGINIQAPAETIWT